MSLRKQPSFRQALVKELLSYWMELKEPAYFVATTSSSDVISEFVNVMLGKGFLPKGSMVFGNNMYSQPIIRSVKYYEMLKGEIDDNI